MRLGVPVPRARHYKRSHRMSVPKDYTRDE